MLRAAARALALLAFGAAVSAAGLFAGLQVAPVLGTAMLAPAIGLAILFGQPLGGLAPAAKLAAFILNAVCWALLGHAALRLAARLTKSS
ncbi:MAG: hypothetical protein ISN28_01115 [Ectothiorhodospiraceae bacterium AqS1]|uniref:Uncharacterized protein n=1 Tax=Candidatus Amphirhobacter heronislandensis TaxID=1732024 RepID=A0A930XWD7_9GAMM|nr:hypothetical protein [Betaproteobacteria bacterium AqS2]MBF2758861.1 hypothetical protein [Ectothiorhodospiraceae bacterium AqS1]